VRSLIDEEKEPGQYSVHWDGRDDKGQTVGSGVYLYRIEAETFVSTKKMIIARSFYSLTRDSHLLNKW